MVSYNITSDHKSLFPYPPSSGYASRTPHGHDKKMSRRKIVFNLTRWYLTATSGTKPTIVSAGHVYILLHQREKKGSIPFSMAIGNGEIMQECFPKHSRMGTARMK